MYLIHDAKEWPLTASSQEGAVQDRRLAGTRLLVLGRKAASTASICKRCLSEGARMAVVDALVDVAADFVASGHAGQAVALYGDMRDPHLLGMAVARADAFMQGIDSLCFFGSASVAPTPERLAGIGLALSRMARQGGGPAVLIRERQDDVEDLRRLISALQRQYDGQGIRINGVVMASESAAGADAAGLVSFLLSAEARALQGQLWQLSPVEP